MSTSQHIKLMIDPDLFARPWNYPKSLKCWILQCQTFTIQCQQSTTILISLVSNIHKDFVVTHTQTNYYNPPLRTWVN